MRTVVIDTNVLLSDPEVIEDFPDAEVVIPDTVLSEIDKLKMARVDAELRYRGREISRTLFELSVGGTLQQGVDLPGGGRLRVVALNGDVVPEGLSTRNADDRIMAIALQVQSRQSQPVTLVTNDLNMLLKAQTYGLPVERIEGRDSFARRFIVRPFQRYRTPLAILAVAIAVFAAIVYLVAFSPLNNRQSTGVASLPKEFADQLSVEQQQELSLLYRLEANPKDLETSRQLAILYQQMGESKNPTYYVHAIRHYEEVLKAVPTDTDSRTDLATCYFKLGVDPHNPDPGRVQQAIKQVSIVLNQNPNHVNANFNLGIFYLNTKTKEWQKAANQFQKVIRLTQSSQQQQDLEINGLARTRLSETVKNAQAAGVTVKLSGGVL